MMIVIILWKSQFKLTAFMFDLPGLAPLLHISTVNAQHSNYFIDFDKDWHLIKKMLFLYKNIGHYLGGRMISLCLWFRMNNGWFFSPSMKYSYV